MNDSGNTSARRMIVSAAVLLVLGCILTAGLWPFHVERNGVSWLKDTSGLRFLSHGAAVSAAAFTPRRGPNDTGFSLELELTPEETVGKGTFLAFDSSPDPRSPFKLSQFGSGLAVQRYWIGSQGEELGKVHRYWFKVSRIFRKNQSVFVTITSNQNSTGLYLNGILAGTSPDPGITGRELAGRLVVGNSTFNDSWKGEIARLAIYAKELTPSEVTSHFQYWTSNTYATPGLPAEASLLALYRFDERSGSIVHNQVDPATNLTIPERYFVLHQAFLRQDIYPQSKAPWMRWSSWKDLGINVFGFVPVGFVVLAYFSEVRQMQRASLLVVLIGFLLSLTIEVSQSFLPNRDSGIADLITNTSGTVIGVLLYRRSPLRAIWSGFLEYYT
jgi:VanZ family protein